MTIAVDEIVLNYRQNIIKLLNKKLKHVSSTECLGNHADLVLLKVVVNFVLLFFFVSKLC